MWFQHSVLLLKKWTKNGRSQAPRKPYSISKQCAKSKDIQLTYCKYYLFLKRGRFWYAKQVSKNFDISGLEKVVNYLIFNIYSTKSRFLYICLIFLTFSNSIIYWCFVITNKSRCWPNALIYLHQITFKKVSFFAVTATVRRAGGTTGTPSRSNLNDIN